MQQLQVRAADVGHELAAQSQVTGHALSEVAAEQQARVAQDGELLSPEAIAPAGF